MDAGRGVPLPLAVHEPREGARVLLVDDEPELLDVFREAIEDSGLTVQTATNGREGLRILESQPVDLVITDLRMPLLGGLDLMRAITERKLDVDVIFLTGYGTVQNAVECMRLGAVDYLLKPVDILALTAKIDKILAERKLRAERQGFSNLKRMVNLSSALTSQEDPRALVKEYLAQIRSAFAPDGLALFLLSENGGGLETKVLSGQIFQGSQMGDLLKLISGRLLERGKPKLLDPITLDQARASGRNVPLELAGMSVLIAPVASGGHKTGAVVVARGPDRPVYTLENLQLLTVFSAHAAAALESLRVCRRLTDITVDIITSYVSAVEAKDFYTKGHSERVCAYAGLLGAELGLERRDVELLRNASILHDIGKIGIPDRILNKPSALTFDEYQIMKQHPVTGRDIVSRVKELNPTLPLIYHHHERFDGGGYPGGLAGEAIPFLVRILSVVDGFEAMVSDRAYHQARGLDEARAELLSGAGSQWDPQVVNAWLTVIERQDVIRRTFASPFCVASLPSPRIAGVKGVN